MFSSPNTSSGALPLLESSTWTSSSSAQTQPRISHLPPYHAPPLRNKDIRASSQFARCPTISLTPLSASNLSLETSARSPRAVTEELSSFVYLPEIYFYWLLFFSAGSFSRLRFSRFEYVERFLFSLFYLRLCCAFQADGSVSPSVTPPATSSSHTCCFFPPPKK